MSTEIIEEKMEAADAQNGNGESIAATQISLKKRRRKDRQLRRT